MQPVPAAELHEIPAGPPTPGALRGLLAFERGYQDRVLRYFAALCLTWERENPGRVFPGLCAEVDAISGRMRAPADQRGWSWGDCRALGNWAYFLQKGVVPGGRREIRLLDGGIASVDLAEFYHAYCDRIHAALIERLDGCDGKLPFLVDVASNRASDDPRNIRCAADEFEASHIFLVTALYQHAMLRGDAAALARARRVFDETVRAGLEFRFVNHLTRRREPYQGHGAIMVTIGAVVDVLKSVELAQRRGDSRWAGLVGEMTARMLPGIDYILERHVDAASGAVWELNSSGRPFHDAQGRLIADPGHAAELAAFLAEFSRFLPPGDRRTLLLRSAQAIVRWVDRICWSPRGLMFKQVDLLTGEGVADTMRAEGSFRTAPWWNLRELAAASARLLAETRDPAFWDIHRRAVHAGYRNYANARIGGCFLQTLDADSGEPLPFHPATGNLDPMHDGRARERGIEALETLLPENP